jgi:hypothetical protein
MRFFYCNAWICVQLRKLFDQEGGMKPQQYLQGPAKLLNPDGSLTQAGWARQPVLDANLEDSHFYRIHGLQKLRLKVWDYYAITTPSHFFSFTISDVVTWGWFLPM